MNKILCAFVLSLFISAAAKSQGVGIGTTAPDVSALLELKSTTRGFLPPRMTAAEKALIATPKAGLLVYQTDGTKGLYIFSGTVWEPAFSTASVLTGWAVNGNAGTTPSSNFIGTTDNQPLKFRVNNLVSGEIHPTTFNVSFGLNALAANTIGTSNTAFGAGSLSKNTTGLENTAIGVGSMLNNLDGIYNVGVGAGSLYSNTSGGFNTAVGVDAFSGNLSGKYNVSFGYGSLSYNTTGHSNTAIGMKALSRSVSQSNLVAVGDSALYWNGASAVDVGQSVENVAIGSKALYKNDIGSGNTATGFRSLYSNIEGNYNTGVGNASLKANTFGNSNTAVGHQSLTRNTEGEFNTTVGARSLEDNLDGVNNTALGYLALGGNTKGSFNTAVGFEALHNNVLGKQNVALGQWALVHNNGGSDNIGVGFWAGPITADLSNSVSIGALSEVGCSNCMVLGSNTSINPSARTMKVGVGTSMPKTLLHVKQFEDTYPARTAFRMERHENTNYWDQGVDFGDDIDFAYNGVPKAYFLHTSGELVIVSDSRMKKDVRDVQSVLPSLMKLQAKTYHYNDNKATDPLSYGFMAQDVEKLFPDFVVTKGADQQKAVAYQRFGVVTVKAIQEQQVVITNLQEEVNTLKKQLAEIISRLDK